MAPAKVPSDGVSQEIEMISSHIEKIMLIFHHQTRSISSYLSNNRWRRLGLQDITLQSAYLHVVYSFGKGTIVQRLPSFRKGFNIGMSN